MERVWDIPKFMDPHRGVQEKKAILSYKYVSWRTHDFLFVFPVEEEQLFSELDDFSWLKRRKKRAVSL